MSLPDWLLSKRIARINTALRNTVPESFSVLPITTTKAGSSVVERVGARNTVGFGDCFL